MKTKQVIYYIIEGLLAITLIYPGFLLLTNHSLLGSMILYFCTMSLLTIIPRIYETKS